ncbi:hypothetical protein DSM104299_01631 [Baekduia alba]|uniref:hypothetical protein n=1 Tax=Baekduia alba TaxID=2997333 RepID=UPI00234204C2|nr:hypothetical protein [Baekduia alba]WCB92931.1 hypothetical protein DSM104299_01631 [Baekduia alba]
MSRGLVAAPWYELRRAQSTKPSTYTCPFCPRKLPAFSEHVLIRPVGQGEGRRHAHLACVQRARAAGRLPSRDEWQATQPRRRGLLARLLRRTAG